MTTKFTVQLGDITNVPSDLLLLKHAKGFHGAVTARFGLILLAR